MGLISFLKNVGNRVKEKIEDAVWWVQSKLSKKKYDEDDLEDHVDVDAVLAEFRSKIKGDVADVEKKCMDSIYRLFDDLNDITKEKFPDLVEIIKREKENAEKKLNGTIMQYVKEHLSKNDPQFLKVLEMQPGVAKDAQLNAATERVFENAEKNFNSKLKKYAEQILSEFTTRLNSRIADQEVQMNQRIEELEDLKRQAESDIIDVKSMKDESAPAMESARCILGLLEG